MESAKFNGFFIARRHEIFFYRFVSVLFLSELVFSTISRSLSCNTTFSYQFFFRIRLSVFSFNCSGSKVISKRDSIWRVVSALTQFFYDSCRSPFSLSIHRLDKNICWDTHTNFWRSLASTHDFTISVHLWFTNNTFSFRPRFRPRSTFVLFYKL